MQVIAREVVNSNKAISRLHTQKAHMMDMEMALKHQLGKSHLQCSSECCGIDSKKLPRFLSVQICIAAMVKVAGTINKSTEVMKIVNDLVQVGSMQSSMREMAKGTHRWPACHWLPHVPGNVVEAQFNLEAASLSMHYALVLQALAQLLFTF